MSSIAVADSPACQVIGTHFDPHPVTEQDSDPESAHLATRVRQQLMSVVETDRELRVAHGVDDSAVHFERVTLWHQLALPMRESRTPASLRAPASSRVVSGLALRG